MIATIFYILLILLNVYIIKNTSEPKNFKDVKERYQVFRKYIANSDDIEPHFKKLKNEIILTGFTNNKNNELGYNVNKGSEIGLCLDGSPNQIFHVLIHELAHSVSSKYAHDDEFWSNVEKLSTICEERGIYQPINGKTKFCGSHIQDP